MQIAAAVMFFDDPNRLSALAAVAGVIIAAASLFVAFWAIRLSAKTLQVQDLHNRLSVKPIIKIEIVSTRDGVMLTIHNVGVGPLIIRKFSLTDGDVVSDDFEGILPDPQSPAINPYRMIGVSGAIPPQGSVDLVGARVPDTHEGLAYLNQCKIVISRFTMIVEYTDIYDSWFEASQEDLSCVAKLIR